MQTQEIKGHLAQLRDYARTVLDYDTVAVDFKIMLDKYEITVNCDDTFQKEYSHRVEQILIYESFDWEKDLDAAVAEIYDRLGKVMQRAERELRYGLNLIGQSIEAGADYRTHVGLEFVSSMKAEQEKTMLLLPNRGQTEQEISQ